MSGTSNRSRILRISREVTAEWNSQPGLRDALHELRPGFAQVMDQLSEAVFASGNRARLAEAAFEDAKISGAFPHEVAQKELVR